MRAVWVDEGAAPRWDLLAAHQITWVYLSVRDPNTSQWLPEITRRGLKAGAYAAWNWYPGRTGSQFADTVHAKLREIAPTATPGNPKVQLNDETHDPARILDLLRRWRQLRPSTDTSWTLEGMQGGWIPPALAAEIVTLKIRVVPQCYRGDMSNSIDTLTAARDLTKRGIPDTLISPFHDAKRLPDWWEGWAFTQGRLP